VAAFFQKVAAFFQTVAEGPLFGYFFGGSGGTNVYVVFVAWGAFFCEILLTFAERSLPRQIFYL